MKKVLTIAGSDCSGGAGIQADLKTMMAFGVYGMSVVTALTAQNTTGVYDIAGCTPDFVERQLDCVFEDIVPDAVKIGMVLSEEIIAVIAAKLDQYKARNVVLDPVMVSGSNHNLLMSGAKEALACRLISKSCLVTPNIGEAEGLSGMKIISSADMEAAALCLYEKYGKAVLIKGGHQKDSGCDLLLSDGKFCWFKGSRIQNNNIHGTGCTLSTAIACGLAIGGTLETSIENARIYLRGALSDRMDLGKGSGPLNHLWQQGKA